MLVLAPVEAHWPPLATYITFCESSRLVPDDNISPPRSSSPGFAAVRPAPPYAGARASLPDIESASGEPRARPPPAAPSQNPRTRPVGPARHLRHAQPFRGVALPREAAQRPSALPPLHVSRSTHLRFTWWVTTSWIPRRRLQPANQEPGHRHAASLPPRKTPPRLASRERAGLAGVPLLFGFHCFVASRSGWQHLSATLRLSWLRCGPASTSICRRSRSAA